MKAPHIPTKPAKSSSIAAIGYSPEHQVLAIKFNSGHTYHYAAVTPKEHEELMGAESIGRHFLSRIMPKKKATKIEE